MLTPWKNINRIRGNDIFISYSRADCIRYSLALAKLLQAKQYHCYLDQYHNELGQTLPSKVLKELKKSSALIVVISPKAITSEPMKQEIDEFKKTGRLIIPVKISEIDHLHDYGNKL